MNEYNTLHNITLNSVCYKDISVNVI